MSDAISPLAVMESDPAVSDQEPVEQQIEEQQPDAEEQPQPADEQEKPEPQQQAAPDQLAKDAARHLREMRQNPETKALGDALTQAYHRDRQYNSLLGSLDDARSLKYAIEAAGGTDALTRLVELDGDVSAMDEAFDKGDPKLIEEWSRNSPDGFKRLVPEAVRAFSRMAPAEFNEMRLSHAGQVIQQSYIPAYMGELSEILSAVNPQSGLPPAEAAAAVRAFNRVVEVLNQAVGYAANGGSQARQEHAAGTPEPEQERGSHDFDSAVSRSIDPHVWGEIDKAIKSLDVSRLSPQAVTSLRQGALNRLASTIRQDKQFWDTAQAIRRRGNQEQYVRFMNNKATEVAGTAARSEWTDRYGIQAPIKRQPQTAGQTRQVAQASAPAASRLLARQPDPTTLDMERSDAIGNFIRGRGHLKSGQPVHWKN